ncbi:NPCBM/NEW2 domain-containing protein [Deinococcus sonorensis]|uniref:NPCBM/NEW2 domain-containing protein n=2 Tax=Deinococcus sonorensis TaxID=309891 RepID=A0AAU7U7P8_9DEIO
MTLNPTPNKHTAPRPSVLGLVTLLTLTLAACGQRGTPDAPTADTAETEAAITAAAPAAFPEDGQGEEWTDTPDPDTEGGDLTIDTLSIDKGNNTLSNERWTTASNGWGPIEKNRSVGGNKSGDGKSLKLNGRTYTSGFGTHANSSMTFNIGGKCATFTSDIGLDDEVGSLGSVVFQVWADGTKLYDSGRMTGSSATKAVNVNVAGKKSLKLVVTNAGDSNNFDHADWANAMLHTCTTSGTSTPPVTPQGFGGPITITKGGTYSGNWESKNPNVPVITIKTSEPVTIQNSTLRGRGTLVAGFYNRVTLRNNKGYVLNPNVYGKNLGRFANLEQAYNITIENNYFEHGTGIYLRSFYGSASKGEGIRIRNNKMRDIDGRQSNGNNGYNGKRNISQAVLFNSIQRVANVDISWNEIINTPGNSYTEENINLYMSSGTASSPMRVHDNYIQGAYNDNPAYNATYPGGGILLGDGQASDPSLMGHARVYNNQIVGTSNHGLGIAGGVDNQIYNNRVISSGRLPDGRPIAAQNVGLYVWDPYKLGQKRPAMFANNVMRDNFVMWTKVKSNGSTTTNPWWVPNCGLNNTVCSGNVNGGTATLDTEKQEYQRWLNKLASSGVKVGPQ